MHSFETVPKKWGNSLGITIPKEVVSSEKITQKKKIRVFVLGERKNTLEQLFGTLKCDKPTQQIMDELDEGYD